MNHPESSSREQPGEIKGISRSRFINLSVKSVTAAVFIPHFLAHAQELNMRVKAIAFDAFALFDTQPIAALAERLYPGKSTELMTLWRNRQFEYTWLRILSKNYKDFWYITEDALVYATSVLQLDLTTKVKAQLMQSFLDIRFLPDASAALRQLKEMSLRLAILSNATLSMLEAGINNSGMQNIFDFVISTDRIKTYKPDPAAYQLGVDAFKLKKEEILFVAFGGWDEAGAKTFGFPTVWINATGLPAEQLDAPPDYMCTNITESVNYIKKIAGRTISSTR
jgi:2-haloacid dehalogenase